MLKITKFVLSKKRLFLRVVSLFLSVAFCLQEMAYSAPAFEGGIGHSVSPLEQISQDPTRFEAPSNFSTLKETHKGSNGAFIIHIQDAHSNLTGQENLSKTLDQIMTKYGVSLVLVEGGAIDGTLDPLKKIASPEITKRVAKSLLMEGQVAGEEYLNLTSNHPMKIIGIEDMSLYLKSVGNYGKLADKREEILQYLQTIQIAVDKLKQMLYPKELRDYEKKEDQSFEERFKKLIEFNQIASSPSAAGNDRLNDFPSIQKLKALQNKEKGIDFNLANLEQAALVGEMHKKGGVKDLQDYLSRSNQLKNQKASQFAHFQNLFEISKEKNISLSKYPNLVLYGEYLKEFSDLDLEQILDELVRFEDKVYVSLLPNQDQRLVRSIDRYLKLLKTAYQIQMSSKEFFFFKANEPDFVTISYLAFINRKLTDLAYFEDLISYKNLLEEGEQALEAFYQSVNQRDDAFIRNAERVMKEQDQKVAVLISGGYHTQNLKKLFEEKNYSFSVLAPVVTSETNQKKYEKLLLSTVNKEVKQVQMGDGASLNKNVEKVRYTQAPYHGIVDIFALEAGVPLTSPEVSGARIYFNGLLSGVEPVSLQQQSVVSSPRSQNAGARLASQRVRRILGITAASVILGGGMYFVSMYIQTQQNPTFAPFFQKASPVSNEVVLDPESDRLLKERFSEKDPGIPGIPFETVRKVLQIFSPNTRHILIHELLPDKIAYLGSMPYSLYGLVKFLELGDQNLAYSNRSITTSPENAKRLWEALSGEPYDLEKVLRQYFSKQGPFAFHGDLQNKVVNYPEDNLHFFLLNVSGADVPLEFKLAYFSIVRKHGYPEGMFWSSRVENSYEVIKGLGDDLWNNADHYERALAFVMEFYSSTAFSLDEKYKDIILRVEGGLKNIVLRLASEPELRQKLLDFKLRFIDYLISAGNSIFVFSEKWSLSDFETFFGAINQAEKKTGIKQEAIAQALRLIHDSGFAVTPNLPEKLADSRGVVEFVRGHLGGFLRKQAGRYRLTSVQDIEKISRVWKASALLGKEGLMARYVDLSLLGSVATPQEVVQILKSTRAVSVSYARTVLGALRSTYYDAVSIPRIAPADTTAFRRYLNQLMVLKIFQDIQPNYSKYRPYLSALLSLDRGRWLEFAQSLAVDDFEALTLLVEELEKNEDPLAGQMMMTYLEHSVFHGVDIRDVQFIEGMRKKLNLSNPVLGDKFIIFVGRRFIESHPIASSLPLYAEVTAAWMKTDTRIDEDIQEIYRLVANFIGNHAIQYIVQNRNTVPGAQKWLETYRSLGFEIPERQGVFLKLSTSMQKFTSNAIVGNWRYLKNKLAGDTASIAASTIKTTENTEWRLPPGFQAQDVRSEGQIIAHLIRGIPSKGFRAATVFDVGYRMGGVTSDTMRFSEKEETNVLDFPLAFTIGNGKPTDLAAEKGEIKNWLMSLYYNFGLFLVYEDGSVHIADKGNLLLSELYRDKNRMKGPDRALNLGDIDDYWKFLSIVKEEKISINTNMLLINGDYKAIINDGKDQRRLLVEFKDGTFGVLNMTVLASTGEATAVAVALGAVKAIYCDTGYYDFMTLYTLDGNSVVLGHSDNRASSNRVFFYQAAPEKQPASPKAPKSQAQLRNFQSFARTNISSHGARLAENLDQIREQADRDLAKALPLATTYDEVDRAMAAREIAYESGARLALSRRDFLKIAAAGMGAVVMRPDWLIAQVTEPFRLSETELVSALNFLTSNVTQNTHMPLSYQTPANYWRSINHPANQTDAVIERLLTAYSLNLYDGMVWTIVHALRGRTAQADTFIQRLSSGRSGASNDIRATPNNFSHNGRRLSKESALFFRMLADEYIYSQGDPMKADSDPTKYELPGYPNLPQLHHEDWRPILGENAWVILGAVQVAYMKNGRDVRRIPLSSPEIRLALSLVPAFEAMQSSIGAFYHAPEGTFDKDPRDISNENNFSAYAALKMLQTVVQGKDDAMARRIASMIQKQENYFKTYAFDRTKNVFYQGGLLINGQFRPERTFAVDVQTWGVAVLGVDWINKNIGKGDDSTVYKIWQATKQRAGFVQNGALQGVGFTDGHDVLSSEWTLGAVLMARKSAAAYRSLHADWSREFQSDANTMRQGVESLRVSLPDGSIAYRYANRRVYIPFGWWANPIPSAAGTNWAILIDTNFDPFVLGGNTTLSPLAGASGAQPAQKTPSQGEDLVAKSTNRGEQAFPQFNSKAMWFDYGSQGQGQLVPPKGSVIEVEYSLRGGSEIAINLRYGSQSPNFPGDMRIFPNAAGERKRIQITDVGGDGVRIWQIAFQFGPNAYNKTLGKNTMDTQLIVHSLTLRSSGARLAENVWTKDKPSFIFLDADKFLYEGTYDIESRIYGEIYWRVSHGISLNDKSHTPQDGDLAAGISLYLKTAPLPELEHLKVLFKELQANGFEPRNSEQEYQQYFERRFEETYRDHIRLMDGTRPFLDAIESKKTEGYDIHVYVLSNSLQSFVRKSTDYLGIGHIFEDRIGATWAEPGGFDKADKIVVIAGAVERRFVAMGGDSSSDVKAAQVATQRGVATLSFATPTGQHSDADLRASGADIVVPDLTHTEALFDKFSGARLAADQKLSAILNHKITDILKQVFDTPEKSKQLPVLRALLRSKQENVRLQAALGLMEISPLLAQEIFHQALSFRHENPKMAAAIIQKAVELKYPEAWPALLQLAEEPLTPQEDRTYPMAATAIELLAHYENRDDDVMSRLEPLTEKKNEQYYYVRLAAINTLGRLGLISPEREVSWRDELAMETLNEHAQYTVRTALLFNELRKKENRNDPKISQDFQTLINRLGSSRSSVSSKVYDDIVEMGRQGMDRALMRRLILELMDADYRIRVVPFEGERHSYYEPRPSYEKDSYEKMLNVFMWLYETESDVDIKRQLEEKRQSLRKIAVDFLSQERDVNKEHTYSALFRILLALKIDDAETTELVIRTMNRELDILREEGAVIHTMSIFRPGTQLLSLMGKKHSVARETLFYLLEVVETFYKDSSLKRDAIRSIMDIYGNNLEVIKRIAPHAMDDDYVAPGEAARVIMDSIRHSFQPEDALQTPSLDIPAMATAQKPGKALVSTTGALTLEDLKRPKVKDIIDQQYRDDLATAFLAADNRFEDLYAKPPMHLYGLNTNKRAGQDAKKKLLLLIEGIDVSVRIRGEQFNASGVARMFGITPRAAKFVLETVAKDEKNIAIQRLTDQETVIYRKEDSLYASASIWGVISHDWTEIPPYLIEPNLETIHLPELNNYANIDEGEWLEEIGFIGIGENKYLSSDGYLTVDTEPHRGVVKISGEDYPESVVFSHPAKLLSYDPWATNNVMVETEGRLIQYYGKKDPDGRISGSIRKESEELSKTEEKKDIALTDEKIRGLIRDKTVTVQDLIGKMNSAYVVGEIFVIDEASLTESSFEDLLATSLEKNLFGVHFEGKNYLFLGLGDKGEAKLFTHAGIYFQAHDHPGKGNYFPSFPDVVNLAREFPDIPTYIIDRDNKRLVRYWTRKAIPYDGTLIVTEGQDGTTRYFAKPTEVYPKYVLRLPSAYFTASEVFLGGQLGPIEKFSEVDLFGQQKFQIIFPAGIVLEYDRSKSLKDVFIDGIKGRSTGARLAVAQARKEPTILEINQVPHFPSVVITGVQQLAPISGSLPLVTPEGILPMAILPTQFAVFQTSTTGGTRTFQLLKPGGPGFEAISGETLNFTNDDIRQAGARLSTARSLTSKLPQSQEIQPAIAAARDYKTQDSISRKLLLQMVGGLTDTKDVMLSISIQGQDIPEMIKQIGELQGELKTLKSTYSKLNVYIELANENGNRIETMAGFQSQALPTDLGGRKLKRIYSGVLTDALVNTAKASKAGLLAAQEARIDADTYNVIPYKADMRAAIMTAIADSFSDENVIRVLKTLMQTSIGIEEVKLVKEVPEYATAETYKQKNLFVKALAQLSEKLYQAYVTLIATGTSA